MKAKYYSLIFILLPLFSSADVGDLLISEIRISPNAAEFIEIYNNGATQVTLTEVYITDATFRSGGVFYYNVVNNDGGGSGGHRDFNAKFPDGATINAGEYQTIAIRGSESFFNVYGFEPTYELYEDGATADGVEDMLPATLASIDTANSGFSEGTNDGEVAILYHWDGNTDFVKDLDYILWGNNAEAVDKTGITVNTHSYLPDTDIALQALIATSTHGSSNSWQRIDFSEGVETTTGGNGFNGADETSEDLNNTFAEASPTPNGIALPPSIVINEVDAVGAAEFIEIYGNAGISLNDVTVVIYEGTNNTISALFDLSAFTMPASGYFLIGDATLPAPDVILPLNSMDDANSGAVAIYFSNVSNFVVGGALTTTDLIDALVYDSGQIDNVTLKTLLNAGQAQINENGNSAAASESNARCPNGGGGALNTVTYMQVSPTAGNINNTCPVTPYYATADTTNAATLRTTLHDIIKGHTSYPYSSAGTDTWEILSFADEDHNASVDANPNVAEAVWMLYKNNSYTYNGGGQQSYNREHTWPKSLGFSNPTNNAPRTDAHHLMMSDAGYNSTRGNKYYDNCNPANDGTCTNASLQTTQYDGDGDGVTEGGNTGSTYPGNSNWTNGSVFEAWNFRKGDVARAMFYMDVRYEGLGEVDSTGTPEPDLILTNDPGLIQASSGGTAYMGILSTLIQWHNQDPVDDIDLQRNEVVFSYQGNRNPFIDHPEWVDCIFAGGTCTATVPEEVFSNGFE